MAREGFTTWEQNDPESFQRASAGVIKALDRVQPMNRSVGAFATRFRDIDQHASVRDTFSRFDYEFFRPNEAIPKRHKDIIGACMEAYARVSVVRQVIDLMGDFCAQGIKIIHPNLSIQRFYESWWQQVCGPERSERFANLLYRTGNVVVKRSMAKINREQAEEWKRGIAQIDLDMPELYTPQKMEIPIRYTYLNPLALDVVAEPLAAFSGQVKYVLELPNRVSSVLNAGMFGIDPAVLTNDIPEDIRGALLGGERHLLLDDEKVIAFFYKKDDWEVWARPMLYSLLEDLVYLEKMKLADLTALDGIISHIRIWKLGSLEHRIMPTDAAISKLSSILLNHVAGGAMDFIWGPDLTIEETSTDLHRFLGSEKYQAVITSIHSGLGIPASLSGATGTFANNFMSLRTLIERLNYGRAMLNALWMPEIRLVQRAMGFRKPAQLTYDNMNFNDEVAEKALWIQLVDRNIISEETLQEKFGQIPEIENIKLKREEDARINKKKGHKVSPYHDAQPHLSKEKIALQRGLVTPGETGMELEERNPDEKSMMEMQDEQFQEKLKVDKKKAAQVGKGRPLSSRDTKKRKKRTVKPSAKAVDQFVNLTLQANQLQRLIGDITTPFFLEKFGKDNKRQLTSAEETEMDNFQHTLLYNCPSNELATEELIRTVLAGEMLVYNDATLLYNQLIKDFTKSKGNITYDEIRELRSLTYASVKCILNVEEEGEE